MFLTGGSVVEVLVDKLGGRSLAIASWRESQSEQTHIIGSFRDVGKGRGWELGNELLLSAVDLVFDLSQEGCHD